MYSDKFTNIVDSTFLDINNIHHLSKDTVNELLHKLMGEYSYIIRECLIDIRTKSEDDISSILNDWILTIKNKIALFLKKIANLIYNNSNPIPLYINLFDNVGYIVQLINIVFRKVFDENQIHEFTKMGTGIPPKNRNEEIHTYFYRTWL